MARHKIGIGVQAGFMPPIDGIVKNARQNEGQGYHSLWWSDHLMSWTPESIWTPDVGDIAKYIPNPHAYLDPIATMATVATATSTIRLGTAVTEILRRHPAMLAGVPHPRSHQPGARYPWSGSGRGGEHRALRGRFSLHRE